MAAADTTSVVVETDMARDERRAEGPALLQAASLKTFEVVASAQVLNSRCRSSWKAGSLSCKVWEGAIWGFAASDMGWGNNDFISKERAWSSSREAGWPFRLPDLAHN